LAHLTSNQYFIYRGSAIAKIVGNNVQKYEYLDNRVTMHVHEEMVDGRKLTEIINETHENVKYLPGHKLPANVVSIKIHHNIIIFLLFI
jgi:glycerol-3-phosphate dehydrogenase (NAD+)